MRVAIDIRPIGDFGVGTYIRNVVRVLGRVDHQNEYFLIGGRDRVRELGRMPGNFHVVPFSAGEKSPRAAILEFAVYSKSTSAT